MLEDDPESALAGGLKATIDILAVTHGGDTTDEFEGWVPSWVASADHPETERPFTEMAFQPMLELLHFLRSSGFGAYIVSAGGIEFMRPWSEDVYGIPPEPVIGSSIETRFEMKDSGPVLVRVPEVYSLGEGEGKPVGIHKFIGRRRMLQWTASGGGARLMELAHHTDAGREWAYDREPLVERLDGALDDAHEIGWTLVDMARDWRVVYPWESG